MSSVRTIAVASLVFSLCALQCTSTTGPTVPFRTLDYTREGGFVGGLAFQVGLSSDGSVFVKRPSGVVIGRMTAAERDSLRQATDGYMAWGDSTQLGPCADCFVHHLTLTGDPGTKTLLYNDATLNGPGPDAPSIRRLIDVLDAIAARVSPVSNN